MFSSLFDPCQVLENTLWNRQLGAMSEEIVAALVCQIYEGALTLDPNPDISLYLQSMTARSEQELFIGYLYICLEIRGGVKQRGSMPNWL
jgi:hypothetical protein